MSTVGVFVKELEKALEEHQVDMAVHSLKDMPSQQPDGLSLGAVLERGNPQDVLISRAGTLDQLPEKSRVGTGSLRRQIQLRIMRPDILSMPLRGNIETRLKKLDDAEYDAIIMAGAALLRLGMEERITQFLPPEVFIPSGCQGVIGIEIRRDDNNLYNLLEKLNHLPTWRQITAERAFLRVLGAGCHAPVGVLADIQNHRLSLKAMAGDINGETTAFESIEGSINDGENLGIKLAQVFLSKGALDFGK